MTILDQLGVFLTNLPVYLVNGMLVLLYWISANAAALVSLACALVITMLPDAQIQASAGYRPGRHEGTSSNGPTLHTLRHTFAKSLLDSGVSLDKVAILLGHSNLNTTRIYTAPGEEDLEDAIGTI